MVFEKVKKIIVEQLGVEEDEIACSNLGIFSIFVGIPCFPKKDLFVFSIISLVVGLLLLLVFFLDLGGFLGGFVVVVVDFSGGSVVVVVVVEGFLDSFKRACFKALTLLFVR